MTKVEYLTEAGGIKKGSIHNLPDQLAQELIDNKIVKEASPDAKVKIMLKSRAEINEDAQKIASMNDAEKRKRRTEIKRKKDRAAAEKEAKKTGKKK